MVGMWNLRLSREREYPARDNTLRNRGTPQYIFRGAPPFRKDSNHPMTRPALAHPVGGPSHD